jgi:hypothetical protein
VDAVTLFVSPVLRNGRSVKTHVLFVKPDLQKLSEFIKLKLVNGSEVVERKAALVM